MYDVKIHAYFINCLQGMDGAWSAAIQLLKTIILLESKAREIKLKELTELCRLNVTRLYFFNHLFN